MNIAKQLSPSNDSTLLGTVQDVSGTTVSVTLNDSQGSGLSFVNGQGYKIGQVGSFVKIPVGYTELFGIISGVGASAVPKHLIEEGLSGFRWIKIQLIGEGRRNGKFQRGISQYPTIGDEVHLVSEADLGLIYGKNDRRNHYVKVGHIAGAESIDALVDINKLITRHSAVVGTTGSGKSTTVAGLLNVVSGAERFPSARIIVLDIHGEYGKALSEKAYIYKINPDPGKANERALYLPFWAMSFDELLKVTFGNLPDDNRARNAIMEKVLEYKQASLTRTPREGVTAASLNVDSPVPFSLNDLWYELYCSEFGTYYSDGDKQPTRDNWAFEKDDADQDLAGDVARAIPPKFKKPKNVRNDPEKIQYLPSSLNIRGQLENLGAKLRLSRFDFLLRPGQWQPDHQGAVQRDIGEWLGDWIGSDRPIAVLDLSGVPATIMNDVIGILLRILYDALFWARHLSTGGRERPLLVVMEEAHSYLNDNFYGLASSVVQRIVKEGRKYGIGAMIVSQRPSEINPTIFSQCGTIFALRLGNHTDRAHVTGAISDNLEGLTDMLPILRTGEAIVLGESVGIPMRTMIEAPPKDRRPDSQDPLVCDEVRPEESMTPGGWGIRNAVDRAAAYRDFAIVWRQQNPSLPAIINTEEGE